MTRDERGDPGEPTAGEILDRLAALRDAAASLRARPAAETLERLGTVLDQWRDPASVWRRELEARLPAATGFHESTVREGLGRALEGWSGRALREWVQRELGGAAHLDGIASPRVSGFETTTVLLAGSIPMPTLLALIAPLVLRSAVLAKPAARDPITAPLLARSIAEVDPLLGRCLAVVPFPGRDDSCLRAALQADCSVAFGSDASVAAVAERLPPARRFVAHGHRLSIAVLADSATRGASLTAAAGGLALDVALWDQLGCLSPVAVYVVSDDEQADVRTAHALAEALEDVGERLPRGAVDTASASLLAQERGSAELRQIAQTGTFLRIGPGGSFAVVCEPDPRARPAPLHRFVRVHRVPGPEALASALAPLRRHLAAAALAASGAETPALADCLAGLGASRICAPGALQTPPLGWHHDGVAPLASLARFTDHELA